MLPVTRLASSYTAHGNDGITPPLTLASIIVGQDSDPSSTLPVNVARKACDVTRTRFNRTTANTMKSRSTGVSRRAGGDSN